MSIPLFQLSLFINCVCVCLLDESYEDEALSEIWDDYGLEAGNVTATVIRLQKQISASTKGFSPAMASFESHLFPVEDKTSVVGYCANHITVLQTSPGTEFYNSSRSRRNSLGDFKSLSSCNVCKPAVITTADYEHQVKNIKNSIIMVPLTDSHSSVLRRPKNRGMFANIEGVRHVINPKIEERELMEANENRDAALMEIAEISSLGDLKQKLEYLEPIACS
ncbi:hypothetical protein F3Y22_tig00112289pilonHSYRG00195 [Hibiscus syriacus]|uniref:Uncharacterized protein n=1 Tax=Hibiscus syriacus TaxID=106335 RepID=A0A6A2XFZ8_HIBSY|nr:hypothetical protein F3Y22_tig00112289pilonHSYRG00195 [Hibiscus syriacus]